ncbi:Thioredoxin-like protein [Ilyonectria robusta]
MALGMLDFSGAMGNGKACEIVWELTRPKVPVLTSPHLPASLDDGQSVALWLCKEQPELVPEEHEEVISYLMDKIYSLQAISLVLSEENQQYGFPNEAAALLEKNGLSPKYRRALEINSIL